MNTRWSQWIVTAATLMYAVFALVPLFSGNIHADASGMTLAVPMANHTMVSASPSHEVTADHAKHTASDCEGSVCTTAMQRDCLNHCIQAAVASVDDHWTVPLTVILILTLALVVALFQLQAPFRILRTEWHRPLYTFLTVRLTE